MSPHPSRIILNKKEILIFNDIHNISGFFLDEWQRLSDDAIKCNAEFTVALSGGRTPVRVYKELSKLKDKLYWNKTHIFLVDERCVPFDHPDSNYYMIRKTLLNHVNIPQENIHPIPADESSADESARRYEMNLCSHFKLGADELPRFNLVLLGIGEDGHTASLFPDAPLLAERKRLVIAVSPPEPYKYERISITLRVINNAENIVFLVTGDNKALALKKVIIDGDRNLPASLVQPVKGRMVFLIDKSSASLFS